MGGVSDRVSIGSFSVIRNIFEVTVLIKATDNYQIACKPASGGSRIIGSTLLSQHVQCS